ASVALDDAIRLRTVPPETAMSDVFEIRDDPPRGIKELPEGSVTRQNVCAQLGLKSTAHRRELAKTLTSMHYVGHTKFNDGFVAHNANVAFGYAAYGKKTADEARLRHSLEIMYAVTGWEKSVLQLTQEAGKSDTVARLIPDFTFAQS